MSKSDDSSDSQNLIEYSRGEQAKRERWTRTDRIEDRLKRCSRALERGSRDHYRYIAVKLRDDILPDLRVVCPRPLLDYDDAVAGQDTWHYVALRRFLQSADGIVRDLSGPPDASVTQLALVSGGCLDQSTSTMQTVRHALESVLTIAEYEDIIMAEYDGVVDATGYGHTMIGQYLKDEEMDLGNPVRVISEASGAVKTLFTGGTGQGKSAALETEAESYYLQNFRDGKDIKLIDIIGTGDGENWLYDVPQEDQSLRTVREQMGLPETYEDMDHDPDVEILVPLTPGLTDEELPYDTESDSFTVRPFTVPAAEIRKPLLVSMITAKLTPQQESIVRDAYDEVDRAHDDWALKDLANEIDSRDELDASKKKPVVRTLRQLQDQGFIRTKESDYTLDWREVFTSTETVTVFSQAFVDEKIAQLIGIGYVVHTIADKREDMRRIPKCALLMREMWTIAPHNQRQEFDQRAAQLQEAAGHMLARLFRVNRRRGVHILADTQQPSDLLKSVREMFNRYVVFQTNRDTVQDIFDWVAAENYQSFYSTLNPKPGHASIVGMVEPAVEERHISYVGPVQYSAPSHHHFDEDRDYTGWDTRAKHLDNEVLRRPEDVDHVYWPDDIPTRLMIDVDADDGDSAPDPVTEPVPAFANECLQHDPGSAVRRDFVYEAFNAWALDQPERDKQTWDFGDNGVKSRFGERVNKAIDGDLGRTKRDGKSAWNNLSLTRKGKEYYEDTMGDLSDSSEPIRGD